MDMSGAFGTLTMRRRHVRLRPPEIDRTTGRQDPTKTQPHQGSIHQHRLELSQHIKENLLEKRLLIRRSRRGSRRIDFKVLGHERERERD